MSTATVRRALALPPDEVGLATLSLTENQWFDRKSVGDENRRLTFSQRLELLYEKGQASFEVNPIDGAQRSGRPHPDRDLR